MANGYGGNWTYIDPYAGLAVSAITSNVVSTRFAFDLTLSFRTTSGSVSTVTYQISNSSANPFLGHTIPEAAWSNWTALATAATGSLSGSSTVDPPLGYRWARILHNASGASWQFDMNRVER